ncbi:Gas vesicle synthesis protein K [Bradyrhizobium sp. ORS 278]|nr:Gas vesicle synthesis protein K [Bradyrhizobium sp. ORS 278]
MQAAGVEKLAEALTGRVEINPDQVRQDLARLVLTILEFLRRLMEMQAVRRVEANSLTDEQEENLGRTLMLAAAAIEDLSQQFGLRRDELNIELGPLGRLI